jgi:hypothetical protein
MSDAFSLHVMVKIVQICSLLKIRHVFSSRMCGIQINMIVFKEVVNN